MLPDVPTCQTHHAYAVMLKPTLAQEGTVRIEESIGQRICARREELALTQQVLGEMISAHLGRAWTRQAVSSAEKGKRSFTAAELVAIAHVLGTSIGRLLTPPDGVDGVDIGDGSYLPRNLLLAALVPVIARGQPLDKMQDTILRLGQDLGVLESAAAVVRADLDALNALALAVAATGEAPRDSPGVEGEASGE